MMFLPSHNSCRAFLLIAALLVVFIASPRVFTQEGVPQRNQARARQLLGLAREAMGGDAVLAELQSLRARGKYSRDVKYWSVQSPTKVEEKTRELSGKVEVEFARPDRFRRRVKGENMRGFGFSYAEVVHGEDAWRDPPLRPISTNRDHRVIDVSDVERTEWISAIGAKQQLSYYSLGFLLQPLPGFPMEMAYAGEFDDKSGTVDVVIAQHRGGFRILLLLDVKTHQLEALTVSSVESVQQPVLVESSGYFDRRFMMETFNRARRERQQRARPPEHVEVMLRFSDRRPVAGLGGNRAVQLPHRITTTLNGRIVEELTIHEFELNRPINPKRFLQKTD
jgi:hypothetical protein